MLEFLGYDTIGRSDGGEMQQVVLDFFAVLEQFIIIVFKSDAFLFHTVYQVEHTLERQLQS